MAWLTEDPWPLMMICGAAALILAGLWFRTQKRTLLFGALIFGLLCPAIWFIEQQILTENERIEQRVHELADAFLRRDTQAFQKFFAADNLKLQGMAATAVNLVQLQDLTIKEVTVRDLGPAESGRTLQSQFRATADVTAAGFHAGRQPSRWKLNWQIRDGQWVIVGVFRLHPLRDEEMEILASGE